MFPLKNEYFQILKNKKNKIDYFFYFDNKSLKIVKKYFVAKFIKIGSFRNNDTNILKNKFNDYPATGNDFTDIIEKPTSAEYKKYKKWFNFLYKHSKNNYKQKITFDEWANNVYLAYESRDPKEGKAKLSLLNFWYDALKYHDDDQEFWTDMLYFGLKIISKGQFGPHVKIS